MSDGSYQVFAIKYARHDRPARDNFLGGDPHEVNMPLDYFLWAIVGKKRSFIVDSGFDEAAARKRGRTITHPAAEGLQALGIAPDKVEDVIVTHLHYDHAGNHDLFPNSRFHLQDREMAFATGRCMCQAALNHPFDPEDVAQMVRRVFAGRVQFHDGTVELAPGLSVHLIGGHTDGLQVVRVRTRRGWVVLASDASHLYANMEQGRPFPIVYNLGDMVEGYAILRTLAESPGHIVPGHDPLVMERYPAAKPGLEGWVAQLDVEP
ncbi:MAG: N-acyl homoserine lactonase family protein [Kiloniellales bacterium]